jgi:hypothetical protein
MEMEKSISIQLISIQIHKLKVSEKSMFDVKKLNIHKPMDSGHLYF